MPSVRDVNIKIQRTQHSAALIEKKSETVRYKTEQSGGWGWFKRKIDFFGGDWGYDEGSREVSKFIVQTSKVKNSWIPIVRKYCSDIENSVKSQFLDPISATTEAFFETVDEKFETITEVFNETLASKNLEAGLAEKRLTAIQKVEASLGSAVEEAQSLHKLSEDQLKSLRIKYGIASQEEQDEHTH